MAGHYSKSFENSFRSIQMLSFTVLYDLFDFDDDELRKFNSNVVKYNDTELDNRDKFFKVEAKLLNEYDIDTNKLSISFPHRAKIKMAGYDSKKSKKLRLADWNLIVNGANHAIRVYSVLVLNELITNWGKSKEDLHSYWDKMVEFAGVTYAEGMTDQFVVKYFEDQIDLVINLNF